MLHCFGFCCVTTTATLKDPMTDRLTLEELISMKTDW